MTKTSTAEKPAPKKRAARKPKALDLAALTRLAEEIAEYSPNSDLTHLRHRWETEEKCKIDDAGTAGTRVRMSGITATCTGGVNGALRNWSQAARRAVLKGGAA